MSRHKLFVFVMLASLSLHGADDAKRRAQLDEMLRLFPKSAAWEQWLQKSGELPPDFEALPSEPFLPDPLKFFPDSMLGLDSPERPNSARNGGVISKGIQNRSVETRQNWPRRRDEILKAFQYYITGTI